MVPPPITKMKTFIRLIPAPLEQGRFFCPRYPSGAGLQLHADGSGAVWWRRDRPHDRAIEFELPRALATLIYGAASDSVSIWTKFPWIPPLPGSLLLVLSIRRSDGTFLSIAWGPRIRTRQDAVSVLLACPRLDAVWTDQHQGLLDNRHGRIVSLQHYWPLPRSRNSTRMEAVA